MLRKIGFVFFALVSLSIFLINVRLYHTCNPDEIFAQLQFLKARLAKGEGEKMQQLFPEGDFFLNVLYGLSWLEAQQNSPKQKQIAIQEAEKMLRYLDSKQAQKPFSHVTQPRFGMFYRSWKAYLQGKLSIVARDSSQIQQFRAECDSLEKWIQRAHFGDVASYPAMSWTADNIVGIAALSLHDHHIEPRYTETIGLWLQRAKTRLDPKTGLLPHSTNPETQMMREGARGSSQTLMLKFLAEIDSTFAQQQYKLFKTHFLTSFAGLPAIREHPFGQSGNGDVDAGLMVFGASASATIVAIAASQANGDMETAARIKQSIEAFGFPLLWQGKKFYIGGALPMGDAFLLWSKLTSPQVKAQTYATNASWRFGVHLVSLLLLVLMWAIWRRRSRL